MKKLSKEDWVCTQPFEFAEIFDHKTFMCCPQWLPEDLGNPNTIDSNWKSEKANLIRQSVTDGSYKYCDENRCPKLNGLKQGNSHGFVHKDEFTKRKSYFNKDIPTQIKFNFDQSCNLKCPSCRKVLINYEGEQRERTEVLIQNIEKQLGPELEHIECTGSGDPFFSRTFRKWLMNFNPSLYPKLHSIHLHTNATLWNRSNWERMTNVHKLVKSCEISVDAATKDTYENKTRIGGKWDTIISNLQYISNLPHLKDITLSFVVQEDNFKEMYDFYIMAAKLFEGKGKDWRVFYNRVVNWGTFTEEEYKKVDIASPEHIKAELFSLEYSRLPNSKHVRHNLPILNESSNNLRTLI